MGGGVAACLRRDPRAGVKASATRPRNRRGISHFADCVRNDGVFFIYGIERERPGSEGGHYRPKMKPGGRLADLPGARFIVPLRGRPKMPT